MTSSKAAIAYQAAKLMAETQLLDYGLAKRKAAKRLGYDIRHTLPNNQEVETALISWLALYPDSETERYKQQALLELNKAADFFTEFLPVVVGSLPRGAFVLGDVVRLHLFADFAESVGFKLEAANIPYELVDVGLRFYKGSKVEVFPQYQFEANDIPFLVTVFPIEMQRNSPISSVTNKPSKRYSISQIT